MGITLVDLSNWNNAARTSTDVAELAELARNAFSQVRKEVARNPATPSDILDELSLDINKEVLHAVAANPHSGPATLNRLAVNKYTYTREAVALNGSTPVDTMIMLASSKHMLGKVLENPNCPGSIKMWSGSKNFAGMTLAQFHASMNGT
jgi:hypothetical protein